MHTLRIGILALQGAIDLHLPHLQALPNIKAQLVCSASDLATIDALILPGGESSTMLKLMEILNLKESLAEFFRYKPSWGICAGAILMAKKVHNPSQFSFGVMDFEIERNAYGRQLESSEENIGGYQVAYIRAPKVVYTGPGIEILARRQKSDFSEEPTWLRSGHNMITTFHPELNQDWPSPWHQNFLQLILDWKNKTNKQYSNQ